jgi:hypothetical protein
VVHNPNTVTDCTVPLSKMRILKYCYKNVPLSNNANVWILKYCYKTVPISEIQTRIQLQNCTIKCTVTACNVPISNANAYDVLL